MHALESNAEPGVSARYWWVNHGRNFRQELDGNYLWSPKSNRNGGRNPSYDNMTRAAPGDVVFSYADGRIGAVGVVIERVRTAPPPVELRSGRQHRDDPGWLLPVRFEALSQPLATKEHLTRLAPLLPARHSPLRAGGERNPGIYLAEVPADLAAALRDLLAGQLQRIEEAVAVQTADQLIESALEEQIWQRSDLAPREKRQLISARLGNGSFRDSVERVERGCRVTGVLDRRHLRASHIKPWRLCDDRERLDGFNGLLLAPHIEHLFARGHISFADEGQLLISRHLNPSVIRAWGLDRIQRSQPFRPEQVVYLHFHREHLFEKPAGGRRS
jgi:putative restriction endonuclease